MGLFSKKKKKEMDLPPPPPRAESEEGEIPISEDFPELPPLPKEVPSEEETPFAGLPPLPEELPEETEEIPSAPEEAPPAPRFKIKAPAERQIFPEKRPLHPLFVSIDDYRFILDGIEGIKKKIASSQDSMDELEKLKKEEEKVLDEWKSRILDIEKKLGYVDKVVLKAED